MHRETCVGDESRFDAPRVQASNSAGQTLPQQALPNPWHDSAAATTGVEVDQPGKAAHHFWARATAARDRELRLPDVPLIVEGLLLRARHLSDAGTLTAAVEEQILDHVAELREGRG